jgi:hypothetical protein
MRAIFRIIMAIWRWCEKAGFNESLAFKIKQAVLYHLES